MHAELVYCLDVKPDVVVKVIVNLPNWFNVLSQKDDFPLKVQKALTEELVMTLEFVLPRYMWEDAQKDKDAEVCVYEGAVSEG